MEFGFKLLIHWYGRSHLELRESADDRFTDGRRVVQQPPLVDNSHHLFQQNDPRRLTHPRVEDTVRLKTQHQQPNVSSHTDCGNGITYAESKECAVFTYLLIHEQTTIFTALFPGLPG